MAAVLAAASAIAACAARADGPHGSWRTAMQPGAVGALLGKSWVELDVASFAAPTSAGLGAGFGTVRGPQVRIAGATLRNLNGWSASLFVSRAARDDSSADESMTLADSTSVNARLARRIARHTTLTLDAFNLFDTRSAPMDEFVASKLWSPGGVPDDYLVHPGERRGVRLGIRWSFR